MKVVLPPEIAIEDTARRLQNGGQVVAKRTRVITENAPPPYTTATLLQDAVARLGWSGRQVMEVAQELFEQGLITYPRTDSIHIAQEAERLAKEFLRQTYGHRRFSLWPKRRNGHGAHEAIRPTDPRTTPEVVETTAQGQLLYRLIWQRFLASYMPPAKIRVIEIEVEVP